ncbi:Ni/Fe-hydrogenase, b-type cytochrome subunit [Vibrio gallicus]|uniref:Ni/Fe-hydrogenase, b-type cytochrome subunit n=1 Tax=Vibrio gallicus TaxID=190897 RepID=UPI0021C441D5|nr:Ni/Fe-hydrogenase, b-type cytochrome subunit [Vibrio gallicus]
MANNKARYAREVTFSAAIRICHWLRLVAIGMLAITGFYISWPFLVSMGTSDHLVQGWVRFTHQIFGFLLVAITMIRTYLFFFSRSDIERRSFKDIFKIKAWISVMKAYTYQGPKEKNGAYNVLQFMTYFFLTLVIMLMCATGLILYANVYHDNLGGAILPIANWVVGMLEDVGGLAFIRTLHHEVTWVFLVFIIVHIYMVIFTAVRFKVSSVDPMISGLDYYHPDHHDHGDFNK